MLGAQRHEKPKDGCARGDGRRAQEESSTAAGAAHSRSRQLAVQEATELEHMRSTGLPVPSASS